ncbi:MAG: T9SS type A sorting domain-containing protein [Cyclobacteriaceae bacterium]
MKDTTHIIGDIKRKRVDAFKRVLSVFFLSYYIGCSQLLYAQECDNGLLLIDQNFDHYTSSQLYTESMATTDFGPIRAYTSGEIRGLGDEWPQKTKVLNGELRAEYMANAAGGPNGGFLFDREFEGVEEAMLEYKVKFDANFTWATGGKLPGLGGTSSERNGSIPSGCVSTSSEYSKIGFSCRLMWVTNIAHTIPARIIAYVYHPNRPKNCGENFVVIRDIKKDQWYTIRQYIKLNTPGQNDGTLRMYVNDELLFEKEDFQYRLAGKEDVKINALIMNTYRGGAATDEWWWSPNTDYTYFDDFKVWTKCNRGNVLSVNDEAPLKIHPNPSPTGIFNLECSSKWSVTSLDGRLIRSGSGDEINLGDQKPGMYLVEASGRFYRAIIR